MNFFSGSNRIVITCNKRLAPYLHQEVLELGYTPERVFPTGVEFIGTFNDCIRLNLNLRCASQVLFSIKEFRVDNPDQLYQALVTVPWELIIDPDGYFSVTSNVDHPSVNNTMFVNVKVKDAIADRIRKQKGKRPNSGSVLNGTVIHLYWKNSSATVFLDSSGETLAKHGYRKIPGKAPMLEALASATVLATKWDRRSPFINPMCGSGTIAIEAALIATNRCPGLLRKNYSFMHILGYDEQLYRKEYESLEKKITDIPEFLIAASDISRDAVKIAKINAAAAGVDKYIRFSCHDFEMTDVPPDGNGVIYFNPEYGERMGEIAALETTYGRIGDFMKKKCQGYTGYIFTGNLELAKKIGLKASRRIEFYTSKIDCRLLEYELYAGSKKTLS